MGMSKKKRNKKYQGREAAQGPVIKKFEVDGSFNRQEWFAEHRLQIVGWVLRIVVLVIASGLGWLIYSLVT